MTYIFPEGIEDLEHYTAALLASVFSLKTLENFHTQALKIGILDEVEEETAATILWESQRNITLYQKQLENISERTNFDIEKCMQELKGKVPQEVYEKLMNKEKESGKQES